MEFGSEFVLEESEDEGSFESGLDVGLDLDLDLDLDLTFFSLNQDQDQGERVYDDCSDLDAYSGTYECEIMEFDDGDNENYIEQSSSAAETIRVKKMNTNTVNLSMSKLKEQPDLVLSMKQKIICGNMDCGAILSHIDQIFEFESPPVQGKIWSCRFCGREQIVTDWPNFGEASDIMYCCNPENLPNMDSDTAENIVIFAVDTSASMGTTVQVASTTLNECTKDIILQDLLKMYKHEVLVENNDLEALKTPQDILMQSTSRNPHHLSLSRLQAIKSGVTTQIEKLKAVAPETRVGLVTFDNDVYIYGDGSYDPVRVLSADHFSALVKMEIQQLQLNTIETTADKLIELVKSLTEKRQTSLGTALGAAVAMASKQKGSKVILCTDGFANVGVGSIEGCEVKDYAPFYNEVIRYCKEWGVSVSIISFDNCGLATILGALPVETGGMVDIIAPKDVDFKIAQELARKTFAVDAEIKFVVHKNMYVKTTDAENLRSSYSQLVGNVHMGMKYCFNFNFHQAEKKKEQLSRNGQIIPSSEQQEQQPQNQQENPCPLIGSCRTMQSSENKDDEARCSASGSVTEVCGVKLEVRQNEVQTNGQSTVEEDIPEDTKCDKDCTEVQKLQQMVDFPFQVQISFKDINGVEGIRVWTSLKPITQDRSQAEKSCRQDTTIGNYLQVTATDLLHASQVDTANLSKEVQRALAETEDLIGKIRDQDILLQQLKDFQAELKKIVVKGQINDDIANKLRHIQLGL